MVGFAEAKTDMLESLLRQFYVHTRQHVKNWEKAVKDALPFAKALKCISEQYRIVKSASWEELNAMFPKLDEEFFGIVLGSLEEEMVQIRKCQERLCELNRILKQNMDLIERAAQKQVLTGLSSKGSLLPPLHQLVEYAEDFTRFYLTLYLQIDTTLSNVDYEQEISITDIEEVFQKSISAHPEVQSILALTEQYFHT